MKKILFCLITAVAASVLFAADVNRKRDPMRYSLDTLYTQKNKQNITDIRHYCFNNFTHFPYRAFCSHSCVRCTLHNIDGNNIRAWNIFAKDISCSFWCTAVLNKTKSKSTKI